jgi:dTDP-4-dehydrorhamnose 3,5-epimerase-like enzyme
MRRALEQVRWIDLPRRADRRGTLTIVGHDEIPFSIARIFYVHDIPEGIERGGHAHHVTEQFVLAIAGEFLLELTDGETRRSFHLDSPDRGVYIPPMIWDRLHGFTRDAVCLVLASTQYAESDYVRDWNEFLRLTGSGNK